VIKYDPIWQVTSRSCEVGIPPGRAISALYLYLSLASGIYGHWSMLFYFTVSCPPGSIQCPTSSLCIPSSFFCDLDNDCGDNSDEPDTCRQ